MATNLLQQLQGALGGDVASRLAGALGESPSAIESAIHGLIPAIISGVSTKMTDKKESGDLIGTMTQVGLDRAPSGNLSTLLSGGVNEAAEVGKPLVASIFGSRTSALEDWLSSHSGISRASAATLVTTITAAVMSLLGTLARVHGSFNAESLTKLLSGQLGILRSALPTSLSQVLGFSDADVLHPGTIVGEAAPTGLNILKWALVPILMLLAVFVGWRSCHTREAVQTTVLPPETALIPAPPPPSVIPTPPAEPPVKAVPPTETVKSIYGTDIGRLQHRTLPGGIELDIPERGVESVVIAFIADPTRPVSTDQWFTLDRLEFVTGSTKLRPSAIEQLHQVAAILKAYPAVHLKIGGYTDNVGGKAVNMKVSQERAEAAMQELISLGIAKDRLAAEGYGEEHPIASNDTEEGRQKNRRIDVRVTKK